jgi:LPS O-antigen subunit length determinant protein (WzzB/FepE family)
MATNEYKEIELIDILNVIWKRKWLIIIPTLLLVIITAVISFLTHPHAD